MAVDAMSGQKWMCRFGRHHYAVINDDNPENRRSSHKECVRCGKFKEIKEYDTTGGGHLAAGGIGG